MVDWDQINSLLIPIFSNTDMQNRKIQANELDLQDCLPAQL